MNNPLPPLRMLIFVYILFCTLISIVEIFILFAISAMNAERKGDIFLFIEEVAKNIPSLARAVPVIPGSVWLSISSLVIALLIAISVIPKRGELILSVKYFEGLKKITCLVSSASFLLLIISSTSYFLRIFGVFGFNLDRFVENSFIGFISSVIFFFGIFYLPPVPSILEKELSDSLITMNRLKHALWHLNGVYDVQEKGLRKFSNNLSSNIYADIIGRGNFILKFYLPSILGLAILLIALLVSSTSLPWAVALSAFFLPSFLLPFSIEGYLRSSVIGKILHDLNFEDEGGWMNKILYTVLFILFSIPILLLLIGIFFSYYLNPQNALNFLAAASVFIAIIAYTVFYPFFILKEFYEENLGNIDLIVEKRLYLRLSRRVDDLQKMLKSAV